MSDPTAREALGSIRLALEESEPPVTIPAAPWVEPMEYDYGSRNPLHHLLAAWAVFHFFMSLLAFMWVALGAASVRYAVLAVAGRRGGR